MQDDLKKRYNEALPSQPIEVTGLNEVPQAGDVFMAFTDERVTRDIAGERQSRQKDGESKTVKKTSLDSMFGEIESSEKELQIIIKGDVQGSIEALTLANASKAIIIGFNVRPASSVKQVADQQGVEIRLYNIIYRVAEDIEAALKGMLAPKFEEIVTGEAEVRDIFKVSKIGTIAGCYVTNGLVKRDALVRVLRSGIVVFEGKLASLKRFKDDAKEVKFGYECGLSIENFNDLKVGDIIEASQMKEVEAN